MTTEETEEFVIVEEEFEDPRDDDNEEDEAKGIYWFYNQFIVTGYEDGPITFNVTWAPPETLEEPVIVPLHMD